MSRVSSLYRLQELDLEIDRARARLAEIARTLSDAQALTRAHEHLAEAEKQTRAARAAARSAEDEAGLQREKMQRTETALYGGSVHNPKELQELAQELEALKRYLSTLEDRLLEAMVQLEEAELRRDGLAQDLARVEETMGDQHASLISERDRLESRVEDLVAQRESALHDVLQEDLDLYRRLRDSMGGVAVARLQENSCAACGMTPSASKIHRVRSGAELLRCTQCGRILYAG